MDVSRDAQVLDRFSRRMEEDIGALIAHCVENRQWSTYALVRSLFPIAESLAALLCPEPDPQRTSAQLSWFIKDVLGQVNPRYALVAHCLCQLARHSLTHTDEIPILKLPDGRKLGLVVGLFCSEDHLSTYKQPGRKGLKVLQLDLLCFYEDLLTVARDIEQVNRLPAGTVSDRYDQWQIKWLPEPGDSELGKAAAEMTALLDALQKQRGSGEKGSPAHTT